MRGVRDLLVGGVGLRRGRRESDSLTVGDTVDFWRVEAFEQDRRLRLQAEMKVSGRAWLEFEVVGDSPRSIVRQTAVFDPRGLSGLVYWYADSSMDILRDAPQDCGGINPRDETSLTLPGVRHLCE
jgi:hypothetical protein